MSALLIVSAYTLAENRSGFYLSGGLGLHQTTVTQAQNGSEVDDSFSGLNTSFKLGGYLNPNLALYYQRELALFSDDESYLTLSGLMGLGGTYYLSDQGGLYIEAGVGLGNVSNAAVGGFEGLGRAFMVGAGFETSSHTQVGGLIQYVTAEDDDDSSWETDALTIGIKAELKL
ncbi:outer membrane beta-barrel protein [Saccharospirillum sp. HFRX-1]|uniref:outer membrane beta-barrel protein n=1 Tax=unclassified Saccharospirillum TaxID=2633430 RepID=UPI00370FE15B